MPPIVTLFRTSPFTESDRQPVRGHGASRWGCPFGILLLPLLCLSQIWNQAWSESAQREVLANGLTLIHVDRRDTHAVHILALVRAGPGDEGPWLGSGMSRTVQAMIQAAARERSGELTRLGDQLQTHASNYLGQTWSSDQVAFSLSTTSTAFTEGINLLARMLTRPQFSNEHFQQALALLRAGDQRDARLAPELAQRLLAQLVFRQHPARLPSRGIASRRDTLNLEAIQEFHRRHYTTNRMTIVVVGNLSAAQVLRDVRRAFGEIPSGDWGPSANMSEPVQFAPRQQLSESPDGEEYRLIGWRTPPLSFYQDHAGLELLGLILSHRFEQRLSDERDARRWARDIQVRHLVGLRNPGLFTIAYRPTGGTDGESWFNIQEILDQLRQDGPSAEELATAKRLWQRRQAEALASVAGVARDLARWEQAVGVPGFGRTFRQAVTNTDAQAIQRLAANHLHPKGANRSEITLVPAERDESDGGANRQGTRSALTDVVPRQEELPFGARLIHRFMPIGLAHVRLTMNAGASVEPDGFYGATALLARLLEEGSQARQGQDFRSYLRSYGMDFRIRATAHHLELHLICFPDDVNEALSLLIDLIKSPALPEAALERAVAEQIAIFGAEPAGWQERLRRVVDATMLSDHYGHRDNSVIREQIGNLGRDRLLQWHQQLTVGSNLVISVYGEFDANNLTPSVNALLTADPVLREAEAPIVIGSTWSEHQPPAVTTLTANPGEEALALVWRGPDMESVRDLAAHRIFTSILTGNQGRGGRIASALSRAGIDPENSLVAERQSLAGRGYWAILVKVPDHRLEEVRELVLGEVNEVVTALTSSNQSEQGRLTANDMSAAQALAVNARVLAMEDQGQASLVHVSSLLRGRSLEQELAQPSRMANLERSDLARIANTYFMYEPVIIQLATPQSEEPPAEPTEEAAEDETEAKPEDILVLPTVEANDNAEEESP
ncbi:MAG: insulinase family protein [Planctomycetota bacterium]|nr:MAG: insulinase family protein [Planctomycetota bacterium]